MASRTRGKMSKWLWWCSRPRIRGKRNACGQGLSRDLWIFKFKCAHCVCCEPSSSSSAHSAAQGESRQTSHLIEFRSTVIFLSPRIKYVSIHRESERDLICKTQVTFNLFEFTILRCPCRLRWRMDVTNISPQITILRRGRTCALCRVQSFKWRLFKGTWRFHNLGKGPYWGLLLVESAYYCFHI